MKPPLKAPAGPHEHWTENSFAVNAPGKDSKAAAATIHEKPSDPAAIPAPEGRLKNPDRSVAVAQEREEPPIFRARPPSAKQHTVLIPVEREAVTSSAAPTAERGSTPVQQAETPPLTGMSRPAFTGKLLGNTSLFTETPTGVGMGRPHPQNHPAAQPEPETVVQIHIGRIEVRAVTSPAAPRTTPAVAAQPRMSLDDYLRQREEKR